MTLHIEEHRYTDNDRDLWVTVNRDDGSPSRAVLVYFHGGGWAAGDRTMNVETRLRPLTAAGIVIVAVDYRLSGVAVWPAQLHDAGDAVEWAAERFPGLPIFTGGASAGGHLAGLIGLGAWEALTGRNHTRTVDGVITYATVSDPLQWDEERLREPLPEPGTFAAWSYSTSGVWPPVGRGAQLLDGADTTVSPRLYNHVRPGIPPFLIISGDRDTCVSYQESVQLFDTISRRGGTANLLEIAGADHEDPAFDTPFVRGTVTAFITDILFAADADAETEEHSHA